MLASHTLLALSGSQEVLDLREAVSLTVGLCEKWCLGAIHLPSVGSGKSFLQPDEELFETFYASPAFFLI